MGLLTWNQLGGDELADVLSSNGSASEPETGATAIDTPAWLKESHSVSEIKPGLFGEWPSEARFIQPTGQYSLNFCLVGFLIIYLVIEFVLPGGR